jgi:nitric oxide reductase subunit B
MKESSRRNFLISKAWIQAIVIVVLCGFLILGMLAYRTYTDEPPIPMQVLDPDGQVLFTGADVTAGQEVFLRNGLMEYGSIFGHGAYLGPDFTADYLHRAALIAMDRWRLLGNGQAADDFRLQNESLQRQYRSARLFRSGD